MKRRDFVRSGLALGGGAMAFSSNSIGANLVNPPQKHDFKLKYAPHFGMFKHHAGDDPIDQLKFMAEAGFKALEDNGMMKKDVKLQEKIASEMGRLGMEMGVFVVDGGDNWKTSLASGKKEFMDNFVKTCREAVEVAKRVNATWMTVVPGFFERRIPMGIQTSNVVEALRRGAEIFEPHGLVMVLEPLSDSPELFLRFSDQTFEICRAVNSPSCKILYDIYHMQRNEGDLIRRMEATWDEIAYIQIGDNPGRKEPTTGEINYRNVFEYIHGKGYQGILGMEHGNSEDGKEGELKLIKAYAEVDQFKV